MIDTNLLKLDWRVVFNRATPPGRRGWGRVRAGQLAEMGRLLPLVIWGQLFSAGLLVAVLKDQVPWEQLGGWLMCVVAMLLIANLSARKWRGRELHSVSRKAIDQAAYHAILFAAVWALPASYAFKSVGHAEQLAICLVTVSMMAGAAFTLSTVPPAAAGYVVVMGSALSNMMSHSGSPFMTAIAPVYTGGLILMVIGNGRAYMQRRCTDLILEERTETVSLLLREYEDSDADWLWQTNRQLCFQNVSARFARAIGRRVHELEGMSILDLLSPSREAQGPVSPRAVETVLSALRDNVSFTEMIVPIDGQDGMKAIELSARPRFNNLGRFLGYRGVGSDVTEARRAADRIQHMARHDALTGLPNRLQLTETLDAALMRASRTGIECAILLIDLDRFKMINDSLGHFAGDQLLRQVADRFAPLLSSDMVAGRLGGDEFALVLPNVRNRTQVGVLGAALVEALKRPFSYDDQHLFVGGSIGVAYGPTDGATVEEIMRNADLALYRAKDVGGNDICFYEPGLHAQAEERRRIELALRTAIDHGEFSLVYQPIVDAGGEIVSFEALIRWSNPLLGSMLPSKFIPVAEETGLIGRIGEWVLRTACAEAVCWPASVAVAVNVSPRQLQDPGFLLTLVSALSMTGLDPHRLELELTETVFLNLTPATQRALQHIRSLGVRLAMDDFGTGYSSLGYLREADFDTLKIDKSFVHQVRPSDPESSAIIKAVVALAGTLGMKTVAEGVESEAQAAMVRALGCDLAQGYAISDPLPPAEARALLASGKRRAA